MTCYQHGFSHLQAGRSQGQRGRNDGQLLWKHPQIQQMVSQICFESWLLGLRRSLRHLQFRTPRLRTYKNVQPLVGLQSHWEPKKRNYISLTFLLLFLSSFDLLSSSFRTGRKSVLVSVLLTTLLVLRSCLNTAKAVAKVLARDIPPCKD